MKPLNRFIKARGFRMATLKMVATVIRQQDFAVSLDLSDAYFHVYVAPAHHRFLHFKFKGKFFQFKAMPFHLCSAPRLFTKLTRAVSWYCRQQGIRIIFYLYDTVILSRSKHQAIQHRNFVLQLFKALGFMVNMEKSDLAPSKQFSFLGLQWDSADHSVALTEEKVTGLQRGACNLLRALAVSCRNVQKLFGLTNFATFTVPHAHLYSRELQSCLSAVYKSPSHCSRRCMLSSAARQELNWWVGLQVHSKSLSPPLPALAISTDALHSGWGVAWGRDNISGLWPFKESDHINVLELQAVFLAVKHWAHRFRGLTVAVHCNNCTAVSYILKEGSTGSHKLMLWAKRLLLLADHWQISLHPAYLSGVANLEADALSRGKVLEEWEILPSIVGQIFQRWGFLK